MKPLEGVRVLEFSTMVTASFATMMMAEQGASVVKIEPIEMGDPMRFIGTSKGGISALFANCNRGKESIRINIKDEEGQRLVQKLASDADVVVHNFRPGVMDKLNLGSEKLRTMNPRLVYLAISGFGTEGPLSGAPAYDPIIQAHSGMAASQGNENPAFVKNLMCDKVTACMAIQAITAALYVREKTGGGQHIDLSMLDAGLFFIFPDGFTNHTLLDDDVEQQPVLGDLIYQLTETKDGSITLSVATDQQRSGVIHALGKEELFSDPRFNSLEQLMLHLAEYRQELAAAFRQVTTDEILERLREYHVPAAKCHDRDEVLSQPQIQANDTVEVREHPAMGAMRIVRSPAKFSGERLPVARHSPAHGQDTDSILSGMGLTEEEISRHRDKGVVL